MPNTKGVKSDPRDGATAADPVRRVVGVHPEPGVTDHVRVRTVREVALCQKALGVDREGAGKVQVRVADRGADRIGKGAKRRCRCRN